MTRDGAGAGKSSGNGGRVSYADIRDHVLHRIKAGDWLPGGLLPSEQDLATEFGCARATVNRALRELSDQGVIDRKRRSGTRVRMTPARQARFEIRIVRDIVEDMNATYRYALVSRSEGPAPGWLAAQLGVAPDSAMLHVTCMHYADNRPFQFEERWINIAVVPSIRDADLARVGPNEWLLREVPFTDAEITMSAIAADDRLAEFLATPPGTPVFRMERTTWFDAAPVTFVRMTHQPGYRMGTRY